MGIRPDASANGTRCSQGSLGPRLAPRSWLSGSARRPTLVTRSRARRAAWSPTSTASLGALTRAGSSRPVSLGGRAEDKTDDIVWTVTCFVTRSGFGRRGISRALARAVVDARQRGDPCPRGLPDDHEAWAGDHQGRAPCRQPEHLRRRRVHRSHQPTLRRVVMRIDFQDRPATAVMYAAGDSRASGRPSTKSRDEPARSRGLRGSQE